MDLMKEHAQALNAPDHGGEHELELRNNLIRSVSVKEEHAELVKQEVRKIWGDYFKPEMVEKYPDLHNHVHNIMQLASKCRQGADRSRALQLLESVNKFSEIFWQTKGKETKRVKAPYKPEEEVVYPILA